MQKLRLNHVLAQRLSPQQLQLIKLLQVPSIAMGARIEEELANNPTLEEDEQIDKEEMEEVNSQEEQLEEAYPYNNIHEFNKSDDSQRKRDFLGYREVNLVSPPTLEEKLLEQLHFLKLNRRQHTIGEHIIGSIEQDGYLRRDLDAMATDLAVTEYLETNVQELEAILKKIQRFDPKGIGARNLQECLLLQLEKKGKNTPAELLAIQIITSCFTEFTKKHYEKIAQQLKITEPELLKEALAIIIKLDPKPGSSISSDTQNEILYPDFLINQQDGALEVYLNDYNVPALTIKKSYISMLEHYRQSKRKDKNLREAASFIRKKLEAAHWIIHAVKQRQYTLLATMETIVKLQYSFFIEEHELNLKPMILKDVAEEIGMDVSTVSRIVNNKSVQTNAGIYPLKFFFTEAIGTTSGKDVSTRAVKKAIEEIIATEDKKRPHTDEKIVALLGEQGYKVARRTVAKYREQLNLPVGRLRKGL